MNTYRMNKNNRTIAIYENETNKMVAFYKLDASAAGSWGGTANGAALWTNAEGKTISLPLRQARKDEGYKVKEADKYPAPGIYTNLRQAWLAQVKAIYNISN